VSAIVGLPILGWKGLRAMLKTVRKLGRLADEVLGGGDKRPGWGKRLTTIETDVAALKKTSATVAAEVRPNRGSNMRDEVTRIAEATGAARDGGGQP
jgi:hypothetical protein